MTSTPGADRANQLRHMEPLVENRPEAMIALARQYAAIGDQPKAIGLARRARALLAGDGEAMTLSSELLCEGVPTWHFWMLRDEVRNQAYDAALRRAVTPDSLVLEIGTGSGILAMMAARAGARVVTCEMNLSVAAAAREVIAANGLSDRITVIDKPSFELDLATDLGRRADILVSEIVSNDLLNEGVLPAHADAVRRLLLPAAKVIPARGRIRFALAEHRHWSTAGVAMAGGFDVSTFHALAPPFWRVRPDQVTFRSEADDLFSFDFASPGPWPDGRARKTVASSGGRANGILQWIAIDLDEAGSYENRPGTLAQSCWSPLFWRFSEALETRAGEEINVGAYHTENRLRLWRDPSLP